MLVFYSLVGDTLGDTLFPDSIVGKMGQNSWNIKKDDIPHKQNKL